MMKLISPCRYSVTFLCRCFAMAVKPICSNSRPSATGSGAVYSMNSKPSVPTGFSQFDAVIACLLICAALERREDKFSEEGAPKTCETNRRFLRLRTMLPRQSELETEDG